MKKVISVVLTTAIASFSFSVLAATAPSFAPKTHCDAKGAAGSDAYKKCYLNDMAVGGCNTLIAYGDKNPAVTGSKCKLSAVTWNVNSSSVDTICRMQQAAECKLIVKNYTEGFDKGCVNYDTCPAHPTFTCADLLDSCLYSTNKYKGATGYPGQHASSSTSDTYKIYK